MGKYRIRHSDDRSGVVIDADSLERWIATARAARAGNRDAIALLPLESGYIAERLAELVADETEGAN